MLLNIKEHIYIGTDDPVSLAMKKMMENNMEIIPVISGDKLTGMISKKNAMRIIIDKNSIDIPCKTCMEEKGYYLDIRKIEALELEEIFNNGQTYEYQDVIIRKDDQLIGMIKKDELYLYALHMAIDKDFDIKINAGIIALGAGGDVVYINEEAKRWGENIFCGNIYLLLESLVNNVSVNNLSQIKIFKLKQPDLTIIFFKKISRHLNLLERMSQSNNCKRLELEDIFNSINDGIYITNREGSTLAANTAWEKITGIGISQVLGKKVQKLEKEGLFSPITTTEVLKTKKSVSVLQALYGGKQLLCTGTPVFDSNGNIELVVTNVRDITELLKLKDSLEKTTMLNEEYKNEIKRLRFTRVDEHIIAEDPNTKYVYELALRIAQVDSTVLITGESGVGKEIIAELIHKNSNRAEKSYLKINCGAIPENLLESELFGYDGGSFTGARKEGKIGIFEMVNRGTILLDEIGELSMNLQVKLLRVLQTGEFRRVGGNKVIKVDVRIIAATNRNLITLIKEGKFRNDLYYRLNVIPINIPPLRERTKDIRPLAQLFLRKFNRKYNRECTISDKVMKLLIDYNWPGNIRELENFIERLVVTSVGHELNYDEILSLLFYQSPDTDIVNVNKLAPLKKILLEAERQVYTLAKGKYLTTYEIAQVLDVSQSTVVRHLQKLSNNI